MLVPPVILFAFRLLHESTLKVAVSRVRDPVFTEVIDPLVTLNEVAGSECQTTNPLTGRLPGNAIRF